MTLHPRCGVFVLQKQVILYLMKSREMIYLKNISTPQELFIPRCREANGDMVLSLKSTINQSVILLNVIDSATSHLYFRFSIELPADMPSGEHEYSLSDDAGELSTGLMILGESSSPIEFKKVIQYEQCE